MKRRIQTTREDRIRAALVGGEVDRFPCSVWMHLSEVDQDPRLLAEETASQNEKYDFDFIKMISSGVYSIQGRGAKTKIHCDRYKEPVATESGIRELGDYGMTRPLAATRGIRGKTLQTTRRLSKIIPEHTPYLQTILSPATAPKRLTNSRLIQDMVEHLEEVHKVLRATTDMTTSFVQANIEAGVSGFFFTIQAAIYDFMTNVLYARFCKPYGLEVINSHKDKTWLNVVRTHGSSIMYGTVSKYPCNCIN